MFDNNDFKGYRNLLGFNSQNAFKEFLGAKDIQPCVDFNYLNALKKRLIEIFSAINSIYCFKYNEYELECFFKNSIERVFSKIVETHIIYKLNNQGRRPEEVCFSWMRGFLVAEFLRILSLVFLVHKKKPLNFLVVIILRA